MGKKKKKERAGGHTAVPEISKKDYERELERLQIELVGLHRHVIARNLKVLVIIEGRDGAGKDGTIKRVVEHLSPREARVVALGKPTERQVTEWYFQRFVPWLPAGQEIVLFNRSWYNRAGVEYVMKFCTPEEHEAFLEAAPRFERMLVHSGIFLLKYYLDITRREQARRLADRERNPLKQWKISPVDQAAQKHWRDYSRARDSMFLRTHTEDAPWIVVRADDKRQARLNVIRDILKRVPDKERKHGDTAPDPRVAREFTETLLSSQWVAR